MFPSIGAKCEDSPKRSHLSERDRKRDISAALVLIKNDRNTYNLQMDI